MFWWLLFGGIVLFGVLLYARLGLMLWRKGMALWQEVERASVRLHDVAVAGAEVADSGSTGADSRYDGEGRKEERVASPRSPRVRPGRAGSGWRGPQN